MEFKNLQALQDYTTVLNNFQENEVVKTDDGKSYIFHNGEWNEVKFESNVTLSLYEINQQILSKKEPLKEDEINSFRERINRWHRTKYCKYYMLLCKEISYYTVFAGQRSTSANYPELGEEVFECLFNLGQVLQINVSDNEIEFWVKNEANEIFCAHLFNYDFGIVKFKR